MTSSGRGMRSSIRGGVRIIRRGESNDMRIMRRKLMYAQQKDRARVLKIARLTSSLRRRRIERNSKSDDSESASVKKENDDEEEEENSSNEENAGDEEKSESEKKKSSAKHSKRAKSEKDGGDDEAEKSAVEDDDDGEENAKDGLNTSSKSKKDEDSSAEADDAIEGGEGEEKDLKDGTKSDTKKEGKKKDKEGNETEETDKKEKSKRSSPKSKHSKDSKTKKGDDEDATKGKKERRGERSSRRDDHSRIRKVGGSHFIKLTCIHCHLKCVTFKEYQNHLYSRAHRSALRQIALRQKAHLSRLRLRQRNAQREIEEKSKEDFEPKFCHICRLHYRQPKAKHQLSEHHKTIKKFLMPYCCTCHLAFKSPMLYETHRCSLEHIRNKARNRDDDDSCEDSADDEMREIDLNKFLTVDSVGEIDDIDVEEEDLFNDSEVVQDGEDDAEANSTERLPVGAQFVKKVDAYQCELCRVCVAITDNEDTYVKKHCLTRGHLKAFIRHKDEEEKIQEEFKKEKSVDDEKDKTEEADETVATTDDTVQKTEGEIDEQGEDKLWEDVDKDLGDLLREVEPDEHDEDEEDESVLNIDIESEKPKSKEINGKKEEIEAPKEDPPKSVPSPVTAPAAAKSAPEETQPPSPTPTATPVAKAKEQAKSTAATPAKTRTAKVLIKSAKTPGKTPGKVGKTATSKTTNVEKSAAAEK